MKKSPRICDFYTISRKQRCNEILRKEGLSGTLNYQEKGCYSCNGLDTERECFIDKEIREKEIAIYLAKQKNK